MRLLANIEFPEDVAVARSHGARGIGLFRSEYLLVRTPMEALGEDEQFEVYRDVAAAMAPQTVTVRTFDPRATASSVLSGSIPSLDRIIAGAEEAWPKYFERQLRALVRAGVQGNIRILLPLVSDAAEARAARETLSRIATELTPGVPAPMLGAMIETPSAVLLADLLALQTDFLSVGTNDLAHFILGVRRGDARATQRADPLHPAVLRAIRSVVRASRRTGKGLSLCGEMASDPLGLVLLLAIGVTEFSMAPAAIPLAAQVVRDAHLRNLAPIAAAALRGPATSEILEMLRFTELKLGK